MFSSEELIARLEPYTENEKVFRSIYEERLAARSTPPKERDACKIRQFGIW